MPLHFFLSADGGRAGRRPCSRRRQQGGGHGTGQGQRPGPRPTADPQATVPAEMALSGAGCRMAAPSDSPATVMRKAAPRRTASATYPAPMMAGGARRSRASSG